MLLREADRLSGLALAPVVGVIVLMWVLQLVLSYRQAILVSKRIADLRRGGTVAVGLGRGRFKSRVYAVVAINRHDRVIGVEVLQGWSTLSRPKPIAELNGLAVAELCGGPSVAGFDTAFKAALCQAVKVLREAREAESKAEGGVAIAQP